MVPWIQGKERTWTFVEDLVGARHSLIPILQRTKLKGRESLGWDLKPAGDEPWSLRLTLECQSVIRRWKNFGFFGWKTFFANEKFSLRLYCIFFQFFSPYIYNNKCNKYFFNRKKFYCILFQFSSVAKSCLTLCDPMNRSTPGLAVHHQLLEFTQAHVHWVGDAIQPSHPLSSPSPPSLNPSQHQGILFKVSLIMGSFPWQND